jgi:hypothetical protein
MTRISVKNTISSNMALVDLNSIYDAFDDVASSAVFQAQYGGGSYNTFRGYGFSSDSLGEPSARTVASYHAEGFREVTSTIADIRGPDPIEARRSFEQ